MNAAAVETTEVPVAKKEEKEENEKIDETLHNDVVSEVAEIQPVAEIVSKPSIKLDSLGVTFGNLRGGKGKVVHDTVKEEKNSEDTKFTDEELQREWQMMCNRMPRTMVGTARRMKNMRPVITDYPNIELVVDNKLLFEEMIKIKGRINATLVKALHNGNLMIDLRLASEEEVGRVLTDREMYEEMLEENSAVKKLNELFNLVIG